jgi:hypothetical protein
MATTSAAFFPHCEQRIRSLECESRLRDLRFYLDGEDMVCCMA